MAGSPLAPASLKATAGNAHVVLDWTAPPSNNGSTVTGYQVAVFVGWNQLGATVSVGPSVRTYDVTGLTNGQSYSLRVAAVNARGPGAWRAAAAVPHA